MLDAVKAIYGNLGPHYAIVSRSLAGDLNYRFLHETYGIRCIPISDNIIGAESSKSNVVNNGGNNEKKTQSTFRILREIAGRSALKIYTETSTLQFGKSDFNRQEACQLLLQRACELTGSLRGDICLMDEKLERIAIYPRPTVEDIAPAVGFNTVIGRVFVVRSETDDYCYLPNVSEAAASKVYRMEDHRVVSELAIPIFADGICAGVLNLESDIHDAYTYEHLLIGQKIASEAGSAYVAARRRKLANAGLDPLKQLMTRSTLSRDCNQMLSATTNNDPNELQYLVWIRDYNKGCLQPIGAQSLLKYLKMPRKELDGFIYHFSDKSLAAKCYKEKRTLFYQSAKKLENGNSRYISYLNAKGAARMKIGEVPIQARPIVSRGHMSAVLVAWYGGSSIKCDLNSVSCFNKRCERLSRIMSAVVNLPDRFLDSYGRAHLHIWNELERAYSYIQSIITAKSPPDVCKATLSPIITLGTNVAEITGKHLYPLTRIRLWKKEKEQNTLIDHFDIWSNSKTKRNNRKKTSASNSDSYSRHTIDRARGDPYARLQHKKMFDDQVDSNCDLLPKDPNGWWIVAPIVRTNIHMASSTSSEAEVTCTHELRGFVSIDSNYIKGIKAVDPIKANPDEFEQLLRFQCAIADVVSWRIGELWDNESR